MTRTRPVEAGCGAAILDDEGRLLLIQRLREPEAGAWGLPGGKIDFGERAADTARREILEELGIEIELTGLACIAETIDAGDGRHWVAPIMFLSPRSMRRASCRAHLTCLNRRSMADGAGSRWMPCRSG